MAHPFGSSGESHTTLSSKCWELLGYEGHTLHAYSHGCWQTSGPCHVGLYTELPHHVALGLAQREQERVPKVEVTFSYNLVLEGRFPYFYPIPFSGSELINAAHIQDVGQWGLNKSTFPGVGDHGSSFQATCYCRKESLHSAKRITSDLTGIVLF